MREVTERDFRRPEFMDADPKDYEFRADGKIVRKDRWETAVVKIARMVGIDTKSFEIDEVIQRVRDFSQLSMDAISIAETALREVRHNTKGQYSWDTDPAELVPLLDEALETIECLRTNERRRPRIGDRVSNDLMSAHGVISNRNADTVDVQWEDCIRHGYRVENMYWSPKDEAWKFRSE